MKCKEHQTQVLADMLNFKASESLTKPMFPTNIVTEIKKVST